MAVVGNPTPPVAVGEVAPEAPATPPTPLRLGDIAQVVEDHQPLIGDALVDDGPGVVLVVEKLRGANTVDVTEGVEAALEAMRPGLRDLKIDTSVYRPADYIESSSGNLSTALFLGLGLVILLLAFAFRHWRLAVISVVTILVSLLAAGIVLYLRGQTFNAMTLAGLALALGVVIDDAIAGTDRVARRLRQGGERPVVGTITDASLQVRGPLAYATLFVLLPVLPVLLHRRPVRGLRSPAGDLLRVGCPRLHGRRPPPHAGAVAAPAPEGGRCRSGVGGDGQGRAPLRRAAPARPGRGAGRPAAGRAGPGGLGGDRPRHPPGPSRRPAAPFRSAT